MSGAGDVEIADWVERIESGQSVEVDHYLDPVEESATELRQEAGSCGFAAHAVERGRRPAEAAGYGGDELEVGGELDRTCSPGDPDRAGIEG